MFVYIIIFFLIYCIYDFINKNYIVNKDWEGPLALPLLGNGLHIAKDTHLVFQKDSIKYNNGRFCKYWFCDVPVIALFDPSFMREIYLKHPNSINSRAKSPNTSILSEKYRGIVTADENYWHFNHSIISKSFNGKKVKSIVSSIEKETKHIIDYMKFIAKSDQKFETRNNFMNFNSNIIFDSVFSRRIDNIYDGLNLEQNQIILAIRELFDFLALFKIQNFLKMTQPLYYLYFKIFGHPGDKLKKILFKYYNEHCDTIDFNQPRDILDSMIIEYRNAGGKEEEKSLLAMSNELILAGVETNSTVMEWFMIKMVNHPQYQEKIYNELLAASKKKCDSSDVQLNLSHRPSTPFFNATLKECMRLFPPVPFGVGREVNQDFQVDGIEFKKGTLILQSFYSMFRDEKYYADPDEFRPERFLLDSNSDNWFPYGIGPRKCYGMEMSQTELYISLSNILLNFKISSIDGKNINEKPNFGFSFRPNEYSIKLEIR